MGKKKKFYKTTVLVEIYTDEIIDHDMIIDDIETVLEMNVEDSGVPMVIGYDKETVKISKKEVKGFIVFNGSDLKVKDVFGD